jgi:hypothetical protein
VKAISRLIKNTSTWNQKDGESLRPAPADSDQVCHQFVKPAAIDQRFKSFEAPKVISKLGEGENFSPTLRSSSAPAEDLGPKACCHVPIMFAYSSDIHVTGKKPSRAVPNAHNNLPVKLALPFRIIAWQNNIPCQGTARGRSDSPRPGAPIPVPPPKALQ